MTEKDPFEVPTIETGEAVASVYPPPKWIGRDAYHWLHAERSSRPSISQWMARSAAWYTAGEKDAISPGEMARRGWEYLGPCDGRPHSKYLDR